jgi:hypothetical protein
MRISFLCFHSVGQVENAVWDARAAVAALSKLYWRQPGVKPERLRTLSLPVRLAPGAGACLTLSMRRYVNRPMFAFPWDRGWAMEKEEK